MSDLHQAPIHGICFGLGLSGILQLFCIPGEHLVCLLKQTALAAGLRSQMKRSRSRCRTSPAGTAGERAVMMKMCRATASPAAVVANYQKTDLLGVTMSYLTMQVNQRMHKAEQLLFILYPAQCMLAKPTVLSSSTHKLEANHICACTFTSSTACCIDAIKLSHQCNTSIVVICTSTLHAMPMLLIAR